MDEPASKKQKMDANASKEATIHSCRLEFCKTVEEFKFNKKRVRMISKHDDCPETGRGILYWMSREQRVQDNWAFLYAQRLAMKIKVPLIACFCLVPKFLDATIRHFDFMLKGLEEVEKECKALNIPFYLLPGEAKIHVPKLVKELNLSGVVTDFSVLRVPLKWVDDVKNELPEDIPFCQVDAHNIVPVWVTSEKLEYAARTIRPKIHKNLSEFLTEFPPLVKHPYASNEILKAIDWKNLVSKLEVDKTVLPVKWITPGTNAGLQELEKFCVQRLKVFGEHRNNPNKDALSNLSPWLHFGQISAQRCILEVKKHRNSSNKDSVDAYIEECVVRRELSDNFCYYNKNYDNLKGAYEWAQITLKAHAKDKREYLYSLEQFEKGVTHDDLWNAAQMQLIYEGKIHGFLRMYWAKKILEWSESPEEALRISIFLNDKYSLDGRDPNGFVGCMWSICGVHDQGWTERAIFGKIRYMNYKGCERKFDVKGFISKYSAKINKAKKG